MRYYHIDLDSTDIGPLRISDLVANLPDDASVWRNLEERNRWPVAAHLLASIVDQLNLILWSKTEDGSKGRNRPDPIPRPGANENSATHDSEVQAMDLDELKEFLSRPRQ